MAFCGPCAREQEAYFAIGELADGEVLAEALERMRWVRADSTADITARMHQGPSGVRGTESLALPFN